MNIPIEDAEPSDMDEAKYIIQLLRVELMDSRNETKKLKTKEAELTHFRACIQDYVDAHGRMPCCIYPACGCDGAEHCDAVGGARQRACRENREGKIHPNAAKLVE